MLLRLQLLLCNLLMSTIEDPKILKPATSWYLQHPSTSAIQTMTVLPWALWGQGEGPEICSAVSHAQVKEKIRASLKSIQLFKKERLKSKLSALKPPIKEMLSTYAQMHRQLEEGVLSIIAPSTRKIQHQYIKQPQRLPLSQPSARMTAEENSLPM